MVFLFPFFFSAYFILVCASILVVRISIASVGEIGVVYFNRIFARCGVNIPKYLIIQVIRTIELEHPVPEEIPALVSVRRRLR